MTWTKFGEMRKSKEQQRRKEILLYSKTNSSKKNNKKLHSPQVKIYLEYLQYSWNSQTPKDRKKYDQSRLTDKRTNFNFFI